MLNFQYSTTNSLNFARRTARPKMARYTFGPCKPISAQFRKQKVRLGRTEHTLRYLSALLHANGDLQAAPFQSYEENGDDSGGDPRPPRRGDLPPAARRGRPSPCLRRLRLLPPSRRRQILPPPLPPPPRPAPPRLFRPQRVPPPPPASPLRASRQRARRRRRPLLLLLPQPRPVVRLGHPRRTRSPPPPWRRQAAPGLDGGRGVRPLAPEVRPTSPST